MAFKLVSASVFTILALLNNSMSPNLVKAEFQTVGQGVVRIDLERKLLNQIGNIQLSDTVDVDKMVMIDINSNAETDLLIDEDETELAVRVLHTAYGLDAE